MRTRGVGQLIVIAHGDFDTPTLFGAIVVLAVIGVALTAALALLERRLLFWHDSSEDREPAILHTGHGRPGRMSAATATATAAPRRIAAAALLALLGLAALLGAACDGDDGDGELREITFMAGFRPQATLPFTAVYVAAAKGYFEDEGLAVTIQHSTQGEHLQLLLAGDVHFTTGTAAQLMRRRAAETPVRSIALFGQRGDQGFVAHADSGIDSPADFAGRSVGFKGGVVPAELLALLASVGLEADDVDLIGVPFDERVFIEGGVDVFPVFLSNEPNRIRNTGVAINVFDPTEYGVSTLGLNLLTHANTIEDDRELVQAFVRAAMRGANYAAANVEEAIEIVLTHAEGADAAHQRFLLETDLRNAQRANGMGRATLDQWGGPANGAARVRPLLRGPGRCVRGVRRLLRGRDLQRRRHAAVTRQ